MDKELLDFGQYLESMLSETQIRILAICLTNSIPVCFYGSGLGKSTLVKILRNAGFENVYAPEDCGCNNAQWSVLDKKGVVALCMQKGSFDRPLPKNPFSKETIYAVCADVLEHTR
jgi:hypothetical protein|nr:MAG TPA: AAA domain protein [Caudoviricetes sp.]